MPRVVLVDWAPRWPHPERENALVVRALADLGIEARLVVWDGPQPDWDAVDLCVVRTPWDYTGDPARFLVWAEEVHRHAPVWNPPPLLRWNADKGYLLDLERRGVPLPPTAHLPRGRPAELAALLAERGWSRYVVKPTVDAGARRSIRGGHDDVERAQAHLDALLREWDVYVQPYLPSIEREGETSLVFLGGTFSHAVRKRPAAGEWRIQPQYGGTAARVEPAPEEVEVARACLEAAGDTLYARVDLVRLDGGAPALMELEVIEPYLFLEAAPGSERRYAEAVAARL